MGSLRKAERSLRIVGEVTGQFTEVVVRVVESLHVVCGLNEAVERIPVLPRRSIVF